MLFKNKNTVAVVGNHCKREQDLLKKLQSTGWSVDFYNSPSEFLEKAGQNYKTILIGTDKENIREAANLRINIYENDMSTPVVIYSDNNIGRYVEDIDRLINEPIDPIIKKINQFKQMIACQIIKRKKCVNQDCSFELLIVEKDRDFVQSVKSALPDNGIIYNITDVRSIEDAVSLMGKEKFDLALFDLNLSTGWTSEDAMIAFRQKFPNIPILVMSVEPNEAKKKTACFGISGVFDKNAEQFFSNINAAVTSFTRK